MSRHRLFKASISYDYKRILFPFNLVSVVKGEKLYYDTNFPTRYLSTSFRNSTNFTEDSCEKVEAETDSNLVKLTVNFPQEKTERVIEAQVGKTVMDAVLEHDNTLLPSACEGQLSCRTCHCLIEEEKMHFFSEPKDTEEDLLDAFSNCKPNSRLACQLKILKRFDNVRIEVVPELKKKNEMEEAS